MAEYSAFGKREFDTEKLIEVLRDYFLTFGVAEEISSDTASQYMSSKFERFLQQNGVWLKQSSAYYAHLNTRAEVGVKSGKRLFRDNMDPDGRVTNHNFLRAMLKYRNAPQPATRLSPAQVVYSSYLRDFLPVVHDKYEPNHEWALVREYRERALAKSCGRQETERKVFQKVGQDRGNHV